MLIKSTCCHFLSIWNANLSGGFVNRRLITIKNNGLSSTKWYLKYEMATDTGLNFKTSDLHSAIGLINFKNRNILKNNAEEEVENINSDEMDGCLFKKRE